MKTIGIVLAQCVAIEHFKGLLRAALDYDLRDLPIDGAPICDRRLWLANMEAWKLLAPNSDRLDARYETLRKTRQRCATLAPILADAERWMRLLALPFSTVETKPR